MGLPTCGSSSTSTPGCGASSPVPHPFPVPSPLGTGLLEGPWAGAPLSRGRISGFHLPVVAFASVSVCLWVPFPQPSLPFPLPVPRECLGTCCVLDGEGTLHLGAGGDAHRLLRCAPCIQHAITLNYVIPLGSIVPSFPPIKSNICPINFQISLFFKMLILSLFVTVDTCPGSR